MIDFQQRRQIKKVIYSRLTLLILLILVIFLGRATYNIYQKYKLSRENYMIVKKDYDNLNARKNMLESEIARLKTEAGIEEEIRGKFSVAKPGETIVTVINSTSGLPTDTGSSKKSFWSRFFSIFK